MWNEGCFGCFGCCGWPAAAAAEAEALQEQPALPFAAKRRQLRPREVWRARREAIQIVGERRGTRVDAKDLEPPFQIGQPHIQERIEAPRTEQCGIYQVGSISRGHHEYLAERLHAIQLARPRHPLPPHPRRAWPRERRSHRRR